MFTSNNRLIGGLLCEQKMVKYSNHKTIARGYVWYVLYLMKRTYRHILTCLILGYVKDTLSYFSQLYYSQEPHVSWLNRKTTQPNSEPAVFTLHIALPNRLSFHCQFNFNVPIYNSAIASPGKGTRIMRIFREIRYAYLIF
jgi:hypothetical protein